MTTKHWLDAAQDHYYAAQAANDALCDIYARGNAHGPTVAGLHQQIGYGLKAAQAAAQIAVACRMARGARAQIEETR